MEDKYGFLMVKYDTPSIIENLFKDIDKNDLYKADSKDYGLEKDTHVTLAPCLDNTLTLVELKCFLKPISLYSATIGQLSMFECDDYDVLKYDVACRNLTEANARIASRYTMHTEFKYHPHMTVAYMKKGHAKKYLNGLYDCYNAYQTPRYFIWSYYDPNGDQQRINFL